MSFVVSREVAVVVARGWLSWSPGAGCPGHRVVAFVVARGLGDGHGGGVLGWPWGDAKVVLGVVLGVVLEYTWG